MRPDGLWRVWGWLGCRYRTKLCAKRKIIFLLWPTSCPTRKKNNCKSKRNKSKPFQYVPMKNEVGFLHSWYDAISRGHFACSSKGHSVWKREESTPTATTSGIDKTLSKLSPLERSFLPHKRNAGDTSNASSFPLLMCINNIAV